MLTGFLFSSPTDWSPAPTDLDPMEKEGEAGVPQFASVANFEEAREHEGGGLSRRERERRKKRREGWEKEKGKGRSKGQ